MKVLNVGGCSKSIKLPSIYEGWEDTMLDIDPLSDADLICDARAMVETMDAGFFDAIYCAHNLEHYYRHDLPKVVKGFLHVVKDDGFVHITVPNMQYVFDRLAKGEDIEDVAYISPAGPIRYVDMIYGLGAYIEKSGQDFMCHKVGFTPVSLGNTLLEHGFPHVFIGVYQMELIAYAFKNPPSEQQMEMLKLKYERPVTVTTESSESGDKAVTDLLGPNLTRTSLDAINKEMAA